MTKTLSSLFGISALTLLALGALFPEVANAQGFVPCNGPDCTACHLVAMGDTILNWLIGILFLVFAVTAFIAGWGLVTSGGNATALSAAKEKMTGALIGLILVLAAWLIVDTVLMALLDGNNDGTADGNIIGFGTPWSEVQCGSQITPATVPVSVGPAYRGDETTSPGGGALASLVNAPSSPSGGLTQAEAEGRLATGNFEIVSSGGCSDPTISTCTSLEGLREVAVDRTLELQSNVGAKLVITGATETGHAPGTYSHGNGYKVDFRTTTELNDHITNNFTSLGGSKWEDPNGNIYFRHGGATNDHWDVTFTN